MPKSVAPSLTIDFLSRASRAVMFAAIALVMTAVAAASQSYQYDIVWDGGAGRTATGTVEFNTLTPVCLFDPCPEIVSFSMTVEGDSFTKSDFDFRVEFSSPLDPSDPSNLVGGSLMDFNVNPSNPDAGPYGISVNTFEYNGNMYSMTSFTSAGGSDPLSLVLSESSVSLTRDTAMSAVTASATGGDEDYTFSVS
ncbi:MAG: hypothetical protein HLUCCA12_17830, partial [Rhodobacteraceae bacterium HLUCCA12]